MIFKRREWMIGVLMAALLGAAPLRAQLNRGVIQGIVSDPQGNVVPGVKVTVRNVNTNVSEIVTSNSAGFYRAQDLVPGIYQIQMTMRGFAPLVINRVQVIAAQILTEDAQLKLGTSLQTVQVTAAPSLIETSASNFSTTLGASTMQTIPLQGRDLQQLVNLLPGVTNVAGPPGTLFGFNSQFGSFPDPTHAQGSDLSVNGGQAVPSGKSPISRLTLEPCSLR